jgi:hypothetical protein
MSLELSNSPGKPEFKTFIDNMVSINTDEGIVKITMDDFCAAMYYVITNTPLLKDDPRLTFLSVMNELVVVSDPNKIFVGWPEHLSLQYKNKDCFSLNYPGDLI